MSDVTYILNAIEQGDFQAADKLIPSVYEELRLLAEQKLSHEPKYNIQGYVAEHLSKLLLKFRRKLLRRYIMHKMLYISLT